MYQVALDAFHGPLDLLLYLVKQHEVDVRDIPVSKITEQFLGYIDMMRFLDVELAGEFIVMASTLMEIKSRLLLPQDEAAEPGDGEEVADPRRELVRQLVEYRRFKDSATSLDALREEHQRKLPREPVPEAKSGPAAPAPVRPVELWDLVAAFARLTREAESLKPTPIVVDDTPQHVYEGRIRERIRDNGRVAFGELVDRPLNKAKLIGLFLAMLELMKQRELWMEQSDDSREIWLVPPGGSPPA